MKQKTLLAAIASALVARSNCEKSGNREWLARHSETLANLAKLLPSGSGIDCGTKIDVDASNGRARVVLLCSFHHMNEGGFYDGWTEHKITVKPDLLFGFTLSISGRNRNEIKEYLSDVYSQALGEIAPQDV